MAFRAWLAPSCSCALLSARPIASLSPAVASASASSNSLTAAVASPARKAASPRRLAAVHSCRRTSLLRGENPRASAGRSSSPSCSSSASSSINRSPLSATSSSDVESSARSSGTSAMVSAAGSSAAVCLPSESHDAGSPHSVVGVCSSITAAVSSGPCNPTTIALMLSVLPF